MRKANYRNMVVYYKGTFENLESIKDEFDFNYAKVINNILFNPNRVSNKKKKSYKYDLKSLISNNKLTPFIEEELCI